MKFRSAAAALIALAVTTAWGQTAAPSTSAPGAALPPTAQRRPFRRGISPLATGTTRATITPRQRLQDMESTVSSMRAQLKQMRAKAGTKDALAKANVDMWELLVRHLDTQLQELRIATAREDMESRRAAMYKQADSQAEAAAQVARGRMAAQPGVVSATSGATPPSTAGQTPAVPSPAASAPTAPTPSTPAPTAAPSPN